MGPEIRDIINLGLLPFVLYMSWLFWLALQKSNDRYAVLLERLIAVIENNTQAFRDAESRSVDVCTVLTRHEAHVDELEDKLDVMAATLHGVGIKATRIEGKVGVEHK
jgi:hypothetical protein